MVVIGLVMMVSCASPAPLARTPFASGGPTAVAPSATASPLPSLTATLEPSSTPTWTGTEILEATLTSLPDYTLDARDVSMAYVPAGPFLMGSDRGSMDEQPVHPVHLDAFYIDAFEVTNRHYKACVEAAFCQPVKRKNSATRTNYYDNRRYRNFPVLHVDWNMAKAYCEWRDARLPTEAEWEKAARGGMNVFYPWGNVQDCNLANYGSCLGDTSSATIYALGASRYGVYNMAGNVSEWVSDWYSDDYYLSSPREDPRGPETGTEKVVRGGSWKDNYADIRSVNRESERPTHVSNTTGFRCAKDTDS